MGSAFSQQQYVVAKPPTGRLTLTSGTPVMASEAASQTTIYYTPYTGAMLPIYDGTGWRERTFAELSLALAGSANWASGSNYDLFIVDDGGTLRLLTGPAWTNDTTRSTAISRLNGLWVNDASMTGRYGASSTMTVSQYRGLYVGTVRMSANGTTTWETGGKAAGGDPGRLFLWNCHNRVAVEVFVGDTTDFWSYGTATYRSANASDSLRVTFVRGLDEDSVEGIYNAIGNGEASDDWGAGCSLDSTSGIGTTNARGFTTSTGAGMIAGMTCFYAGQPGIGMHFVQATEYAGTGTVGFYGDQGGTAWQSGLLYKGMH